MNDIFNVELEQNILGCFLLDNKAYFETMGKLKADDFYDGVHRDIFEVMEKRFNKDQLVSPVMLKDALAGHEGLAELGGAAYLVRLAGSSISIFAIREHVRVLQEVTRKRALNRLLVDASESLKIEDVTPEEVVGRIEASFISSETHGTDGTVSMLAAVSKAAEIAAEAHQSEGVVGVTSGLVDLDRMTGGLQGGELVLLGGRPSMGKTAVALSMALSAARKGDGVAVSSLEMTPDSLALRAVANETAIAGQGIAYTDAKRGSMTEEQAKVFFETCADVGSLPIEILPSNMRDMGAIYAGVKKAQRILEGKGTPLKLIVIDYLQLISGKGNRFEQISEISIALKGLAMKFNLPVLALSQLSRALESRDLDNRRPMLSDLRESGQLEQDADMVLFCYRHEYYLDRETPNEENLEACLKLDEAKARVAGKMEIIVAKQRMGEIGTVHVGFDAATNFIYDADRRYGT